MRAKPKRPSPQKQAALSPAEQKRREKEFARDLKAWEKERAKYQRELDRQYAVQLRALERMGIYEPKGKEITPYRKKRIRAAYREYGEFMAGDFAFVKLPDKKAVAKAKGLQMKTTRKGAFIEREGYTRVKAVRDKKTGQVDIVRSGKVKRGPSGGERRYKSRIPLDSLDSLTSNKERLRREAEKLGPLKGKERLAFVLTIKDQYGYSRTVYTDIEKLIEDLEKYEKRVHWQAQIFRHVHIEKTESAKDWFREHPTKDVRWKKRKVNLKGRNL